MPAGCFDYSQSSRGVGPARQRKDVADSQITIGRQTQRSRREQPEGPVIKNVIGEIKLLDESGEWTVVFATLNTIDRDGDVGFPNVARARQAYLGNIPYRKMSHYCLFSLLDIDTIRGAVRRFLEQIDSLTRLRTEIT